MSVAGARRRSGYLSAACLAAAVGLGAGAATAGEVVKPFARGKLLRTVDGVRFSLYVPKRRWENGPHEKVGARFRDHTLLISKSTHEGQAAEEVIYWTGVHGSREATECATVPASAPHLSRGALAIAMASAPGAKLSGGPWSLTVGGRPATRVMLRVTTHVSCQPGFFFTWPHSPDRWCWGALWCESGPGDVISVWIVDVGKRRLFFIAMTRSEGGEWGEISDIIRSVRFH